MTLKIVYFLCNIHQGLSVDPDHIKVELTHTFSLAFKCNTPSFSPLHYDLFGYGSSLQSQFFQESKISRCLGEQGGYLRYFGCSLQVKY